MLSQENRKLLKGTSVTSDHICLKTSIVNLVRMIPLPEDEVLKIDSILCALIDEVEKDANIAA